MWKWLGGCLLVCVAVIGLGVWSAYRKLAPFSGATGAETVAIAAPVTRVFASLANADSLSGWMAERLGMTAGHHGMLVPGDTLHVGVRFTLGAEPMKWTVTEVRPNQLLALQLRNDSSGKVVASRQFTLAAKGESTLVMSAVSTPMADSIRANRSDTVKPSDAFVAGASKILISALRMQSHIELQRLKTRIEGPAPSTGRR